MADAADAGKAALAKVASGKSEQVREPALPLFCRAGRLGGPCQLGS